MFDIKLRVTASDLWIQDDSVWSYSGGSSIHRDKSTESHQAFYGIWCYGAKDEESAEEYMAEARNLGFADARLYLTTDWSNLNSEPYYVVTCGIYESEADAQAYLSNAKQLCAEAYIKYSGDYIGESQ